MYFCGKVIPPTNCLWNKIPRNGVFLKENSVVKTGDFEHFSRFYKESSIKIPSFI